jgi:hypothetical protein
MLRLRKVLATVKELDAFSKVTETYIGRVIKESRSGNASYRAIPDPFYDAESKNDVHFGPQKKHKQSPPTFMG